MYLRRHRGENLTNFIYWLYSNLWNWFVLDDEDNAEWIPAKITHTESSIYCVLRYGCKKMGTWMLEKIMFVTSSEKYVIKTRHDNENFRDHRVAVGEKFSISSWIALLFVKILIMRFFLFFYLVHSNVASSLIILYRMTKLNIGFQIICDFKI